MSDLETIKSIFTKAGWSLKEEKTDYGGTKLELGGYYGIEVYFDKNGEIEIE